MNRLLALDRGGGEGHVPFCQYFSRLRNRADEPIPDPN